MKRRIIYLSIGFFLAAVVIVGCQKSKKEEDAQDQVDLAKENLKEVHAESNSEQWKVFKREIDAKVSENNNRISELKEKIKDRGKDIDVLYKKRVDQLEQRNTALKAKISTFKERSQSDWESFKREFNHDADELGQAIKDIGVDNKK